MPMQQHNVLRSEHLQIRFQQDNVGLISHCISKTVITHLLEDVGLKQNDVTRELKASRISKNSTDLCKLMDVIIETLDPFAFHTDKEFLSNIATGKSAPGLVWNRTLRKLNVLTLQ